MKKSTTPPPYDRLHPLVVSACSENPETRAKALKEAKYNARKSMVSAFKWAAIGITSLCLSRALSNTGGFVGELLLISSLSAVWLSPCFILKHLSDGDENVKRLEQVRTIVEISEKKHDADTTPQSAPTARCNSTLPGATPFPPKRTFEKPTPR